MANLIYKNTTVTYYTSQYIYNSPLPFASAIFLDDLSIGASFKCYLQHGLSGMPVEIANKQP